ncbi:MAG: HEPN domain-containing protein [Verrucomicrobiota bacterium]|nr:HEPN domain-containing protein [Verrucomicrobiota bacterium]
MVRLRLANADEALSDALALLDRGSLRGAADRTYYAAFHAVSALALSQGKVFAKHQGVISFFHADCVRTGQFDACHGRALQQAFEARTEADYEDDAILDRETVSGRLADVRKLIEAIKAVLPSPGA